MKRSTTARRVPRKIGADDGDDTSAGDAGNAEQASGTSIRRPVGKSRKSTNLRQSFGPSTIENEDDEPGSVIIPKRSALSRIAIQKNAAKKSSLSAPQLPRRDADSDDDRPSYNAASLQALKDSTPSTPQQFESTASSEVSMISSSARDLDLSSKFGNLTRYDQPSAIPTAAEIAEKKARRARIAKEQQAEEFISLDPDDPELDNDDDDDDDNVMKDEHGRLILKPKDKYGQLESRLVPDDEDIMENFDEFTEDGKIHLGRKAEAEAIRKRKQNMAAQIAEAEGASDSGSDGSEKERTAAFEAAQTKHGTYSQKAGLADPADLRPRTPPLITPIPTLDDVIERVRKQVAEMQSSRMQRLQEMERLQREKIRLAEEEVRIQRALKETADKFESLRKEKSITQGEKESAPATIVAPASHGDGLEEKVDQDISPHGEDEDDSDDEDEDADAEENDEAAGYGGLGFGSVTRGLGAGLGFAAQGQEP